MSETVGAAAGVAGAVLGAVQITQGAAQVGGSGFQVSGAVAGYPAELLSHLPDEGFVHREVLVFEADGYFWDNRCSVAMHGFFSATNAELVCLPELGPVPVNRYMKSVGFSEGVSSETLTSGLLSVQLQAMESVYGSPQDPHLQFWVSGRFDPAGFGDGRYAFRLLVGTYGQVSADRISTSGGITVTCEADHVRIRLDQ